MLFKKIRERREAELKRQKRDTLKKVGAALVIGSVVSTVVTLFTAPKSGKELRSDVVNKVEEGADIVKENATKLAQKTSDVAQDAMIKGQEIKEKAVSKFEKVKSDITKTVNDKKDKLAKVENEVKENIEAVSEVIESDVEALKEEVLEEIQEKLES